MNLLNFGMMEMTKLQNNQSVSYCISTGVDEKKCGCFPCWANRNGWITERRNG